MKVFFKNVADTEFEKKNCFRNRKRKCFGGDESDKEGKMLKVFWKGGRQVKIQMVLSE